MFILILSAFAADKELDIGLGVLPTTGDTDSLLGVEPSLPMIELRGGWPVHRNIALVATLAHGSASNTLHYWGDDSADEVGIQTRSWYTTLAVGAKFNWDIARWFEVYGLVQGVGMHDLLRLDDDPESDDNLTQVEAFGFTGGAAGSAGVSFRIPLGKTLQLGFYSELGGAWTAPAAIGDVAEIQFSGMTGRLGTGLRF